MAGAGLGAVPRVFPREVWVLLAPVVRAWGGQVVRVGLPVRPAVFEAFAGVVGHAAVVRGEHFPDHSHFLLGASLDWRPVFGFFERRAEVRVAHALDQSLDLLDLFGPQVLFCGHVSLLRVFDRVLVDRLALCVGRAVQEDVHLEHSLVFGGRRRPRRTFHRYFSI